MRGGAPRIDISAPPRYNGGMEERYSRTALLLGAAGVEKLKKARVAVFGLGGVGRWCAEARAPAQEPPPAAAPAAARTPAGGHPA